jgi:hypothetical protein
MDIPSGSTLTIPSGSIGPSTPIELPESTIMKNSMVETHKLLSQIRAIINPFFAETSKIEETEPAVLYTTGSKKGQIKKKAKTKLVKIPPQFTTMATTMEAMATTMGTMATSMEALAAAQGSASQTNDTQTNESQEGGRRKRRKTLHKRGRSRGRTRR